MVEIVTTYRRNLAILESRGNAVELKLSVDVGLLHLGVCRLVDVGVGSHVGDRL